MTLRDNALGKAPDTCARTTAFEGDKVSGCDRWMPLKPGPERPSPSSNSCIVHVGTCRLGWFSATQQTTVPADTLDTAVADIVANVHTFLLVVGTVADDGELLLPRRRAADVNPLLLRDGLAALADTAKRFGWAHGREKAGPKRGFGIGCRGGSVLLFSRVKTQVIVGVI